MYKLKEEADEKNIHPGKKGWIFLLFSSCVNSSVISP